MSHKLHIPAYNIFYLSFIYNLRWTLKRIQKTIFHKLERNQRLFSLIREQIKRCLLLLHESESNCKSQSYFDFWWVPYKPWKPLQQVVRNFHGPSDQDVCFCMDSLLWCWRAIFLAGCCEQYCLCQFTLQCQWGPLA